MEEILATLVAMQTVTGAVQATQASLGYVENFFTQRGMHLRRFEWDGYEALVATTQRTKTPEIMLYAHLDVMPAPEHMFILKKEHGKLLGRGVYDMKCALAIYMQLVDDLQPRLADYDFGITVVTDEELGGKDGISGFRHLLDEDWVGKGYVMPDGGESWQLQTFEKGFCHYTLEAHGTTAHGSRPWMGENAVTMLMDMLHELRGHFTDLGPDTDTFNIGTIQGGEIVNKVPHYAMADIEMRLNSIESATSLPALVEAIAATHGIAASQRALMPPTTHSLSNPYIAAFAESIHKITGVVNRGVRACAGSDARYLGARNIPCALTYPIGGGHHSDNEWVEAASFHQFYDVIADYIEKMARLPSKKEASATRSVELTTAV